MPRALQIIATCRCNRSRMLAFHTLSVKPLVATIVGSWRADLWTLPTRWTSNGTVMHMQTRIPAAA